MLSTPAPPALHAPATDPAVRLLLGGSLVILAGLAWAWTLPMAGMPDCHRPGLGPYVVMWTVMMAAMMFPAMIPVVLAFAAFTRPRGGNPTLAAAVFVAGYLVVWGLLGAPAYALTVSTDRLLAAVPALATRAAPLGGALLVLCGLFQLTPLKDTCLTHCRAPHLFLAHHWRDGLRGAVRMGAEHGLFCAGCCASLMVVLLVVGIMNLAWMVALSALIYLEKVVPAGRLIGRAAGLALCAAGVARMVV